MNKPRTGQRFSLKLPVEVQWRSPAGDLRKSTGKIRDISGSGIFIDIPIRVPRATNISINAVLPLKVAGVPLKLLCKGRVVRWNEEGQVQGVGATIDEYEVRPRPRNGPGGKRSPKATN
jgi:hypothetical protein